MNDTLKQEWNRIYDKARVLYVGWKANQSLNEKPSQENERNGKRDN